MNDYLLTIINHQLLANNIYQLQLQAHEPLPIIKAGQFIMLSIGNDSFLLRRPFAICEVLDNSIVICYQIKGNGTKVLSAKKTGDILKGLFPLGNSFPIKNTDTKIALVGGGIGIFPLIAVLKEYAHTDKQFYSFMGFKNQSAICYQDLFQQYSHSYYITTDDGSYGEQGNAVSALMKHIHHIKPDVLLACGPLPMLQALKNSHLQTKTFVSLEERMGCGIGACLVCVCKKQDTKANVRICKDGPIFDIHDIVII